MDKQKVNTTSSRERKRTGSSSHYRIKVGEPIATQFVKWEVKPLETLSESKVYLLREKLNRGKRMTRKEKDWLCQQVNSNTYLRTSVPLMGYRFEFFDVLNKYLVCQYGKWTAYYAPDRTSLRKHIYGNIEQIVEISKY